MNLQHNPFCVCASLKTGCLSLNGSVFCLWSSEKLESPLLKRERCWLWICKCVLVVFLEKARLWRGGSVSEVHTGAEQRHQLLLVVSDVPLHDFFTRAQQPLERLDVYYCTETNTQKNISFITAATKRRVQMRRL